MRLLDALGRALLHARSMIWQITWSLILGFTLSVVVHANQRIPVKVNFCFEPRSHGGPTCGAVQHSSTATSSAAKAQAGVPHGWSSRRLRLKGLDSGPTS
jgi:hypothetical protein